MVFVIATNNELKSDSQKIHMSGIYIIVMLITGIPYLMDKKGKFGPG